MSINSISFNDKVSHISVSTDQGFIIFSIENELEKQKIHYNIGGSVGISKMFGKTNINILIGSHFKSFKSKDVFVMWDGHQNQSILEIDMKEPIKNALINKTHLFAILEKKICLFDWKGRLLETKSTFANDKGLCTMSLDGKSVATLGLNKGDVAVWRYELNTYLELKAHNNCIDAIALSSDGAYIATASEVGTLIRVFDTITGLKKYEFRRGTNYAQVYDLCFNDNATLLACSSNNGTIHIWDLYNDPETTKNMQSKLSGLKSYLPQYFSSEWSMKQVTIDTYAKSTCAFDSNNNLHVVCYDGNYYKIMGKTEEFKTMTKGKLHINNK